MDCESALINDTLDSDEDVLLKYRTEKKASPVIIKNCVATAFFGQRIDLEEISWRLNAEFNPSTFAAAKLRLKKPSTTALLFASGKLVCTGAASEFSAHVAILKYYRMVNSITRNIHCLDVCIENMVGTAYLGYNIDLKKVFESLNAQGKYSSTSPPAPC